MATKHPSSRRYPPEVKQRAVQLVLSTIEQQGERHGHATRRSDTPLPIVDFTGRGRGLRRLGAETWTAYSRVAVDNDLTMEKVAG